MEGPWELPSGWRWLPLHEVADAPERGEPSKRFKDSFSYLDVSGIDGTELSPKIISSKNAPSRARQFLEPNDSVISGVRVYLRNFALIAARGPDVASTAFCVLRPKSRILPRYLYRWLTCDHFLQPLLPLQRGNSPPAVLDGDIREQLIPIPDAKVIQQQIVDRIDELFSELDDGERALAEARAGIKTYRRSLLTAAVIGRLTAAWRSVANVEVTNRKRSDKIAEYFEAQFEIPGSWRWEKLGRLIADTLIGLDKAARYQSREQIGAPYIKMNNISMDGKVSWEGTVYVALSSREAKKYTLRDDDILFNTRNSLELVGKAGLVKRLPSGAVFNNNLMRIRFCADVLPEFAILQLCSPVFRRRMELIKRATTSVAAIYRKDLFDLPFAVPPLEEQREIVSILSRDVLEVDLPSALGTQIKTAYQSVLGAAFRGELIQ